MILILTSYSFKISSTGTNEAVRRQDSIQSSPDIPEEEVMPWHRRGYEEWLSNKDINRAIH